MTGQAIPDPLSKRRLKAWVRLLGVTRRTERKLRQFLRVDHGTTLPRFDVLAALWRHRDGVTMSDLSRMLLVSNGNATTVVDRLEADGLVRRSSRGPDRRSVHVAMTDAGHRQFEILARDHERAVSAAFAMLSEADLDALTDLLKRIGTGEAA